LYIFAALSAHAGEGQFVPICMNGDAAGKGICPSQPKPGKQQGEWSCTRDTKTNLVWSIESVKGTWDYAKGDYAKSANLESRCGFSSDWRLPTRNELLTILVRESGPLNKFQVLWNKGGTGRVAIDTRYFPETRADAYWTTDTLAPDPSFALFVYFRPGFDNEGNAYADSKSEENHIRLVHDPR